jgi:hypothetical protein
MDGLHTSPDQSNGTVYLQAVWDACWGKTYPIETVDYRGSTFSFYNTQGPLGDLLPNILEPRMLIREEYRLAYDYFEQMYRTEAPKSYHDFPNFIMTGQSGIGALISLSMLSGVWLMAGAHVQAKVRSSSTPFCDASGTNSQWSSSWKACSLFCSMKRGRGDFHLADLMPPESRQVLGRWRTLVSRSRFRASPSETRGACSFRRHRLRSEAGDVGRKKTRRICISWMSGPSKRSELCCGSPADEPSTASHDA